MCAWAWRSEVIRGSPSEISRHVLDLAPMFVIDYVIVHELAHLIEPNHTARFRGIVRTHAPGMEQALPGYRYRGYGHVSQVRGDPVRTMNVMS